MATIPASENEFPEVLFSEGAAPAAPAAGLVKAYAKSDGLLYSKDDAGAETALGAAAHIADTTDAHDASAVSVDPTGLSVIAGTDAQTAFEELDAAVSSGGISPTIVDAKGDLIAATAADTVARLAAGGNGSLLEAQSGQTTGLLWRAGPTGGRVVLSAGNYTGTTGSFGDVTGASVTITTLARRCRVGVVGCAQVGTNGDAVVFDIDIDGARQGGTNGLTGLRIANSGHRTNFSFTFLTDVLSAASHTFKLQAKRATGSGTVTIFADSTDAVLELWVEETLLTS